MESMRKTMIHNVTRAKSIRFSQIESLRSMICSEDRPELPNSFVSLHFSVRQNGSKDYDPVCVVLGMEEEIDPGMEMFEAFKHVLEIRKDGNEVDQLLLAAHDTSDLTEIRITAVSLSTGVNSKNISFLLNIEDSKPKMKEGGTLIQTTFVDGSLVLFVIEDNNTVNLTASTHPLPIPHSNLKSVTGAGIADIGDLINHIGNKHRLSLDDKVSVEESLEDQAYFATALLSASSATKEDFDMMW